MEFIENNKFYKFLPNHITTLTNINMEEKIFDNDIFEKYKCTLQLQGELIIWNSTELRSSAFQAYNSANAPLSACNQANIIADNINNKYKIIKETYEIYQKYISLMNPEKDRWIYNIIDGLDEQESLLFKDNVCIIIPSYTWVNKNIQQLHILCLPLDKTLRCLRSLEGKHIELLKYMKNKTIKIIEEIYGIDETQLKIFLHYEPSTYHLHIHFINTEHKMCDSSIEYCHDVDNIIYNLSIKNNYYQDIILNKRII